MSENTKVTASHLRRAAIVYVRQSTLQQVERNHESTARPSPGSSTASTARPPADCHTPPVESNHCATTGTSTATSPSRTPPTNRKENCSP